MPKRQVYHWKLSHCCILIEIGIILLFVGTLFYFVKECSMKEIQNQRVLSEITDSWRKGFIFDVKRIRNTQDSTACPSKHELVKFNFKDEYKFCFNNPKDLNFATLYKRMKEDGTCINDDVRCGVSQHKELDICLPKNQHDLYGCPLTDFRVSSISPDPRYYTEVNYYQIPSSKDFINTEKTYKGESLSSARFWKTKTLRSGIIGVKSVQDINEAIGYRIIAERPIPIASRCFDRIEDFIQLSDEQSQIDQADFNAYFVARYIIFALLLFVFLAIFSLCIKNGFFWSIRKAMVSSLMLIGIIIIFFYFLKLRNNHRRVGDFSVSECFDNAYNNKLSHLSEKAEFDKFWGLIILVCLLIMFLIAILSHASLQQTRKLQLYGTLQENIEAEFSKKGSSNQVFDENYNRFREHQIKIEALRRQTKQIELRQTNLLKEKSAINIKGKEKLDYDQDKDKKGKINYIDL